MIEKDLRELIIYQKTDVTYNIEYIPERNLTGFSACFIVKNINDKVNNDNNSIFKKVFEISGNEINIGKFQLHLSIDDTNIKIGTYACQLSIYNDTEAKVILDMLLTVKNNLKKE